MFLRALFAGLAVLSTVHAFPATKGSPCEDDCALGILEGSLNYTCDDDGYSSTDRGQVMKACLECEGLSTAYISSVDNDVYWYLCMLW